MGEALRLVESFSELREGLIVLEIGCPKCGGAHRFTLGERTSGFIYLNNGRTEDCHAFLVDSFHPPKPPIVEVIAEKSVRDRRVFLVLDVADRSASTTRQLEIVR